MSQRQFGKTHADQPHPSPLTAHSLATGRRSALPLSCMNTHTHYPYSPTSKWQTHTIHCPIHLPGRPTPSTVSHIGLQTHTTHYPTHRNDPHYPVLHTSDYKPTLSIVPHTGLQTHTIHCPTHRTAEPHYPLSHTSDCRPTLPTVPHIGLADPHYPLPHTWDWLTHTGCGLTRTVTDWLTHTGCGLTRTATDCGLTGCGLTRTATDWLTTLAVDYPTQQTG